MDEAIIYLENPIKKLQWSSMATTKVNSYWYNHISNMSTMYSGLTFLSHKSLAKCKTHPIIQHKCYSTLDIGRVPVKLRLLTGTYVLQTKRIKYYRNEDDPTCSGCLLCGTSEETISHFILHCPKLNSVRMEIMTEIHMVWKDELRNDFDFSALDDNTQLQLILDNTAIIRTTKSNSASVAKIESLSRILLFRLHIHRTKLLDDVGKQSGSAKEDNAV